MFNIDYFRQQLSALSAEYSRRHWVQYTTGLDLGLQEARLRVNEFKKNPDLYRQVCGILESSADPAEKRKAKLLYDSIRDFHHSEKVKVLIEEIQPLQNRLMDLINKYRCEIDGKEMPDTEIRKILALDADPKRREAAYNSRVPLNHKLVDAGFLKLLDLRRELAAAAGFSDFVAYQLQQNELPGDLFDSWSGICADRKLRYQAKKRELAQKYLGLDNLNPWDESFLKNKISTYNQATVDMTAFFEPIARTFAKFGFEIDKLNITYDIFPRKNKSEWGYNFTIEPGRDSRVLANVSNRFFNYNVLLHETAHGVHFLILDPADEAFHAGVSGIVSEGFANFFGSLSTSREFLSEIFPAETAEAAFAEFAELRRLELLQSFSEVSRILFDRNLYLTEISSGRDIQDLLRATEAETLGESAVGEIPWANLIHHTGYPIYLHNYFLGDVMCEKMKQVFSRSAGLAAEKAPLAFGNFWKEKLLMPSGRLPFPEMYQKVCEEPVSIADYMDAVVKP